MMTTALNSLATGVRRMVQMVSGVCDVCVTECAAAALDRPRMERKVSLGGLLTRLGTRRTIMAQFVFLYRRAEEAPPSPAQMQERMQRWMAWMKDLSDKGHLKDRGQPLERSGKLVRGTSQKSVVDGPYAEKDLVIGYTRIEARDLAQASELSAGCPILEGGGLVEVRPVMLM